MLNKLLIFVAFPIMLSPFYNEKKQISQWHYLKCIKVIDGDTIVLLKNGKNIKVRLAYIDAPELTQNSIDGVPVGLMITNFLQNLIQDKVVKVRFLKRDIYHRWLGEVYIGKYFINLVMLKKGLCILYPLAIFRNLSQKDKFLAGFHKAFNNNIGIWKTKGILNPYHFRKLSRK